MDTMLNKIYGSKSSFSEYTLALEDTDMTFLNMYNYYLGTKVTI